MQIRTAVLLCLCLILLAGRVPANPLPYPQAHISELTIDQSGNWKLEITFWYSSVFHHQDYDSICISASDGSARMKLDHIEEGALYVVITPDSLDHPLKLNRAGDCLKVICYIPISSHILVDSLPFGDVPGSVIGLLPDGYSICRVNHVVFCKDKTPTLGGPNDTAGTTGYLQGYMYDKNGKKITSGDFGIDNAFIFGDQSWFTTSVFSRRYECITVRVGPLNGIYQMEPIDTIRIDIDPDSVLVKDIHFRNYIVGVKSRPVLSHTSVQVLNYPNPFNGITNFVVTLPEELRTKPCRIVISDNAGKVVRSINMSTGTKYSWDGNDHRGVTVSTGVYFYSLFADDKRYAAGSLVFLK
ncbi:MAG: FlgD immunoglobulin-like domain containing protein [Bacteroidota bacterium]